MPTTMFLDPARRQINFESNVFSESLVQEHAKQDIAGLLKVAQAKLPAETTPHRIIHLVKMETDNAHLDNILGIYSQVVAQENQKLKENNVPIHLSITNGTGGNIYFAAANYEPIEKLHLDYPITLNLKDTKQEDYLKLIGGMGLSLDDERQLTAIVPRIYQLASAGRIDLQAVTITKTSEGLGVEEKKQLDIHLGGKTAQSVLALVNKDMRNHESKEKYSPRIQRLGNAIIRVVRENVALQDDVERILTPQELASAMLAYKEGKSKEKPPANCIGVSLLTNELLRISEYGSSIITLHAINKYGEELDGHATAAVVADGWLIDPALLTEPKKISKITFDRKDKGYLKFSEDMAKIYLVDLGNGKDDNRKPSSLEFHEDKEENELKALYLLENGTKIGRHGKGDEGREQILEASRLNPKNFFANYRVALDNKEKKPEDAAKLFEQCADLNPGLFLANYYAASGLSNIFDSEGNKPYLKEALSYAQKSTEINPKFFFAHFLVKQIANQLQMGDLAADESTKMEACPQPPEYKK